MFGGFWNVGQPQQQYTVKPTKKAVIDFIKSDLQPSEVIMVESFETFKTRHICRGTNTIQLLESCDYVVPTIEGNVIVRIIWCPNCRKLLIDKSSVDFY